MAAGTLKDAFSDVLDRVEVEGMMTGGFAVRGPWVSQGELSEPFKLIALVAGTARVSVDGRGGPEGPIDLMPGDVVLLNHRTRLDLRGGSGATEALSLTPESTFDATALATADLSRDNILVGGAIRVSPVGTELLRNALPGLVHVAAASPASSRSDELVQRLFDEASGGRLGSAFAIRQHAQLLLLEVLRAHLGQEQPPIGWLRLLADERLAPALRHMHADPGRSWGLAELASAAGMSRTVFAERFRSVAGEPPLTYLGRWRMVLAQQALQDRRDRRLRAPGANRPFRRWYARCSPRQPACSRASTSDLAAENRPGRAGAPSPDERSVGDTVDGRSRATPHVTEPVRLRRRSPGREAAGGGVQGLRSDRVLAAHSISRKAADPAVGSSTRSRCPSSA
jgi:AraC-like DNA-binding protein